MNHYQIISDFGCNLPENLANQYEIKIIPTHLHIEGEESVLSNRIDISDFYLKLREKKMIRTAAINMQTFKNYFSEILENGDDILYIGMSSGLSATFTAAKFAAMELSEEYPERKIYCVDTRSGCGGIGLAIYLAALKKEEGADLETNYAYISDICTRLQSWFSVDDLFFLKRGGRLSSSTAIVGSLFMIKPILTADRKGKLFSWGKARGKKGVMEELVNKVNELAFDPENSIFFISHSDCMEDALQLDLKLRSKWNVKDTVITDISPAFGAHCGPGALAIFFVGKETNEPGQTEKNETSEI